MFLVVFPVFKCFSVVLQVFLSPVITRMLQVLHLYVLKVYRVLHLPPCFVMPRIGSPPPGASWAFGSPPPLLDAGDARGWHEPYVGARNRNGL